MRLAKAAFNFYRYLRRQEANILDDGTVIIGNMRCTRPKLSNLCCKGCGNSVGEGKEYWMSKHASYWRGEIDEKVEVGYCRKCTAKQSNVLLRKPLLLHIHDHSEEKNTI